MMECRQFKGLILCILCLFSLQNAFAIDKVPKDSCNFWPKILFKAPDKVENIRWALDGSLYVMSSGKTFYIGRSSTPETPNEMTAQTGKLGTLKTIKDTSGRNYLYAMTESNHVIKAALPSMETAAERKVKPGEKIARSDYAPNGDLVALAMQDGSVVLLRYLSGVRDFMEDNALKGHNTTPHSLAFSPNSEFLASASKDGALFVWSVVNSSSLKYQLTGYKNSLPVVWTSDSKRLILAENEKKLVIKNLQDTVVQGIEVAQKISTFKLTPDGKQVAVLTTDNVIYVYDILSGALKGFIPAFNRSPIQDFDITPDEESILVGHKDGTVFLLSLDDVFLAPGTPASGIGGGRGGTGDGSGSAAGFGASRADHNVEARITLSDDPVPFSFAEGVSIGYTNGGLIKPFYFGGFLTFKMGNPMKEEQVPDDKKRYIKYRYDSNGTLLGAPYLMTGAVDGVVGFTMFPIDGSFEFFTEVVASFEMMTLWNKDYATGKFYPSGRVGVQVGVAWNAANFTFGGEYDFGFRTFMMKAGVGYRFEIGW